MHWKPQVLAVLLAVSVSSVLVQSAIVPDVPNEVSNNNIDTVETTENGNDTDIMEKTENGVLILDEESIPKIIQENEIVVIMFCK